MKKNDKTLSIHTTESDTMVMVGWLFCSHARNLGASFVESFSAYDFFF